MKFRLSLVILVFFVVSSLSAQTRIRIGQSQQGQLDSGSLKLDDGSYYDLYRYDSPGNETIVVTLRSSDFDAYLTVGTLENNTFTNIGTDDDSGGGTDARLEVTLQAPGAYYLRANTISADETGSYTIRLESAPNSPARATISVGQRVSGTLSTSSLRASDNSFYDPYLIQGVANTSVSITLESSDFDAYLTIGASGGEYESLESDDDGAGGTNSRLMYRFTDSRVYEIRANTLSEGETGNYTLSVTAGPTSTRTPASAMRTVGIDSRITGTLDETSALLDDDSYYEDLLITGAANTIVEISVLSGEFDAYLNFGKMENGEFKSILTNDDCKEDNTNSCAVFTFPDNGTYVIRANTLSAGETGEFSVWVVKKGMYTVPAANSLPALANNRRITGTLGASDPNPPGASTPHKDYKLTVGRNDTFELFLSSEDFDTVIGLLDSSYTLLESDDDGAGGTDSKLTYTFRTAGTYVVRVSTISASDLGAFTLEAKKK